MANTIPVQTSTVTLNRGESLPLFRYIRRQRRREQLIVISSDEESDGEISVVTQPFRPVSSGRLDDPIDLDSDTEPIEKYNIQNRIGNTHIVDTIPIATPESILSEPTLNPFVDGGEDGDDEEYQQEAASVGSLPDQESFQNIGINYEKNTDLEVSFSHLMQPSPEAISQFDTNIAKSTETPNIFSEQHLPVTAMQVDTNMAESSRTPKLFSEQSSIFIKSEEPYYAENNYVPSFSSPKSTTNTSNKRALQLFESSPSPTVNNYNQMNGLEEKEEDDIDIEALRSQAPRTVQTKKFDDMSLSEVLGSIELYLQSVTEIGSVSNSDNKTVTTRHTRRTPRQSRTSTPPQISSFGESSQGSQLVQGSSCDFPLPRPYIPTHVWYNCTWEDWAQFNPGNILHVPFSDEEKAIVEEQLGKHQAKKLKMSRSSLDFWQVVEALLPGRTAQDCRYFSYDMDENKYLHEKPVMIKKPRKHSMSRNEYMMVRQRRNVGVMRRSNMKLCQWMNLSREDTIRNGSGDALSLAIYRNPRTKNMSVAAGSLCDENVQYNLPGNLRIWDSVTEEVTTLAGHRSVTNNEEIWRTVTDVKMSKDGSLIISASHDGSAKLWKSKNGRLISTLCYHERPINQLAVNTYVTGNVIATCSNDGSATIWALRRNGREGNGQPCDLDVANYREPVVECIQFGRRRTLNKLFMGVSNNDPDHPGYVTSFDTEQGTPLTRYESIQGNVCAIDISPSGQFIASGNYSNFDGLTGDRVTHIHDYRLAQTQTRVLTGHGDVNVVSFSPCEKFIASGNADRDNGEVVIFDLRNPNKALHKLSHNCANSTFLSPDSSVGIGGIYWMSNSKQFVSGGGDSKVKLWNISGATELLKSYETTNCVTSLAVDEDCMTLAAGVAGAQGIVHVWQP